jgi:hypothetical protein
MGVKLEVVKVEPKEDIIEKEEEEEPENQGSSCVENQVIGQSSKEIDKGDILEDPFVQKAKELFEPSKIVVKSKV